MHGVTKKKLLSSFYKTFSSLKLCKMKLHKSHNVCTRGRICSIVTSSTTNPTWIDAAPNQSLSVATGRQLEAQYVRQSTRKRNLILHDRYQSVQRIKQPRYYSSIIPEPNITYMKTCCSIAEYRLHSKGFRAELIKPTLPSYRFPVLQTLHT